jgi:hypothetical protein
VCPMSRRKNSPPAFVDDKKADPTIRRQITTYRLVDAEQGKVAATAMIVTETESDQLIRQYFAVSSVDEAWVPSVRQMVESLLDDPWVEVLVLAPGMPAEALVEFAEQRELDAKLLADGVH